MKYLYGMVMTLFLVAVHFPVAAFGQPSSPGKQIDEKRIAERADPLTYKVVAAGLGGFMAWALTKAASILILRRRLQEYLVVVINAHIRQYTDTELWLMATREKTIREGYVVKMAAAYTVDELEDITELRPDFLKLLRTEEIIKITKLISRLRELEAIIDGFCADLKGYRDKGRALKAEDVDYLKRKQDRILSYMKLCPRFISSLSELPGDYAGIVGADSLVSGDSAECSYRVCDVRGEEEPNKAPEPTPGAVTPSATEGGPK